MAQTNDDYAVDMVTKVWEKLIPYWKQIVIGLSAVIIVILMIWGTVSHMRAKELATQLAFYEIMKIEDVGARALKLEEFAGKHVGDKIGFQADIWLGDYAFAAGENENAATFYGRVISSARGNPIYYIAVDSLIPVFAQEGKFEEGANLSLEASKKRDCPNKYHYKIKAAELFMLDGKYAESKNIYDEIINEENSPAPVKLKAEEKLLWLSLQS